MFSWRQAVLESSLPPQSRHILLTLACYMDVRGEGCFPSNDRLCTETGYARSTLHKYLTVAIEDGWIVRSKHGYGGQRWARSQYAMSWPSRLVDSESDDPEGSSPHEPPSSPEGSSPHEPPSQKGSSSHGQKVVRHANSISPGNSPDRSAARAPAPDHAHAQGDGEQGGAGELAYGDIVSLLQAHGTPWNWCTSQDSRDRILGWVGMGVTTGHITQALAIAHQRKPGETIGPRYLDPIIREQFQQGGPDNGARGGRGESNVDRFWRRTLQGIRDE